MSKGSQPVMEIHQEHEHPLIQYLSGKNTLSTSIRKDLLAGTFSVYFRKNKHIISPIDHKECLYLIVKGAVRGFVKDGEEEITTWIHVEGRIVGSIKNYNPDPKNFQEYLQSLEECHLIAIPYTLIEGLLEKYPKLGEVSRRILARHYHDSQERALLCRIPSAERRYERLLSTHAHLFDRIPLKYLASYLAIRQETLSRLRTKAGKHAV